MTRPTLLVASLLAPAITLAAPTITPAPHGWHIQAKDYAVTLNAHGGIAALEANGGTLPLQAIGGGAWVLRAGEAWIASGELWHASGSAAEVTHAAEGDALVVHFASAAAVRGTELRAMLLYRFAESGEFRSSLSLAIDEGTTVSLLSFPAPVAFEPPMVRGAVFPFHRGVALTESFFRGEHEISTTFPAGFTDFAWFDLGGVGVSISVPVTETDTHHRKRSFLVPEDAAGRRVCGYHVDYDVDLPMGSSYRTHEVLFQIGRDTVSAARRHWEVGASGSYPHLSDKLAPEHFEALARSVLLKYPDGAGPKRFEDFAKELPSLPAPSLLHLCGYMPGGHDSMYPDYLPPDPARGTVEDLRALLLAAKRRGILTMPYANPTWWDPESPTMKALGEGVAAIGTDGAPRIESYEHRRGVVVSSHHPGARERIARTAREFAALGVDFLFEDQVGARHEAHDANAANPNAPFGYADGLRANAHAVARTIPPMTEGGWDRLAEFEIGFCGDGALLWEQPAHLPVDAWRPYPLMTILANEHTATYPHNLAGERMAHTRADMTRIVALGGNLAFDLNRGRGPWLDAAAHVQRRVLAGSFGQRIVAFEDRRGDAGWTRLAYANGIEIIGNWTDAPLPWEDRTIAPRGFLWRTADRAVVAGWFRTEAGEDLRIEENGTVWSAPGLTSEP